MRGSCLALHGLKVRKPLNFRKIASSDRCHGLDGAEKMTR